MSSKFQAEYECGEIGRRTTVNGAVTKIDAVLYRDYGMIEMTVPISEALDFTVGRKYRITVEEVTS